MQLAVIYDSPTTQTASKLTFAELDEQVARLAAVLQDEFGKHVMISSCQPIDCLQISSSAKHFLFSHVCDWKC